MPRTHTREVLVERFGNLKLPLGGKYEYKGVRGKQGRARDRFQGYTPKNEENPTSRSSSTSLTRLLWPSPHLSVSWRWATIRHRTESRERSAAAYLVCAMHEGTAPKHMRPDLC